MSRTSIALTLLLAAPATLRAQDTFTPIGSGLKVGQKVHVIVDAPCTADGCPGESVKGKVAKLDATSIVIDDGKLRHELSALDVRLVERPKDRIWNGVLYGFAGGFSVGFAAVMADGCNPGHWCILDGPSVAAGVGLFTGAIGAGIGALTDAAISSRRVVFYRSTPGTASTNIAPIVARGRAGVQVSVRF